MSNITYRLTMAQEAAAAGRLAARLTKQARTATSTSGASACETMAVLWSKFAMRAARASQEK